MPGIVWCWIKGLRLVARYWSNRIEANFIAEVLGNLDDINPHIRGCKIDSKSLIDTISLLLVNLRNPSFAKRHFWKIIPSFAMELPTKIDSGELFKPYKTLDYSYIQLLFWWNSRNFWKIWYSSAFSDQKSRRQLIYFQFLWLEKSRKFYLIMSNFFRKQLTTDYRCKPRFPRFT